MLTCVIKYLGSKRTLVPVLSRIAAALQVRTAVDLFTGTTRVAQAFKRQGLVVTANDLASYSKVLGDCYIGLDADGLDLTELGAVITDLQQTSPAAGYFTETFCINARYFQPKNGARIDAIRDRIEREFSQSPFYPVLLTALMLAADKVDSTTGVQMAYLKKWSHRSSYDLDLRLPELLPGVGCARQRDATELVGELPQTDLMYLDPPYNQHRYFSNYHIWETLVRWDAPEYYGVACKRLDCRDPANKSAFNSRREITQALGQILSTARAKTVIVSYNDESWIKPAEMMTLLRQAGHAEVRLLEFDARRYIGAQIGIFNPNGEKTGQVSHLRNTEYLFIAGQAAQVEAAATAAAHP